MKRSDITFSGDDSHAFLPWVMGIMSCIAMLLLCLGLTISGWIIDQGSNYSNSFTVSIPASGEETPEKIVKIRDLLQTWPGIVAVTQVPEEKLRDMLKPWLGNTQAAGALPLPTMFDVAMENNALIDYNALQAQLLAQASGTELDAHERWIKNFSNFSSALSSVMSILALLIITGLALMIAFMSRASLKLHARTVQLLHSIGAEDGYIARQFQFEASQLTLMGTIPGCIAAFLAYWGGGLYITSLHSAVLPPLSMSMWHVLLVMMMPLACGLIAWIAARISVLKQLQRVL